MKSKFRRKKPSADLRPVRTRLRRAWPISLLAIAACLGGVYYVSIRPSSKSAEKTLPELPVNLQQLDPEVAALIHAKMDQVRQNLTAESLVDLGLVYEVNGLWNEAFDAFQSAGRLDSEDPNIQLHLAIAAHEVGEFALERQLLQQLAADHPDLVAAQHRLGVLLLEEGKLPAAEHAFQAVIQHGPQMPEGYAGLADVRIRQGDYQVAVNLLEKAIEMDPKYQGAHFLLGSAYQRLGMTDKALPHLKLGAGARTRFVKDSLRIRADQYDVSTKARLARGIQFMVDRKAAQAAAEFQKVLQAEPDNVTALSNLAGVFVQQNRLTEARQLLNKSLEIDSTKHATYVNLANLAALEGDLQQALEWADRGVELGSNAELPYRVRANILLQMERLEPAYDDALRALELIPNDPQALEQCGDLAYRLRKLGDARTYYNRALRIDSRRPIAWIGLTQVNMTAGQFGEAKQTLANAQQLAPQHPAIKILSDRLDRLRSN